MSKFVSLADAVARMTDESKNDGFGDWERSGHTWHRFEKKIAWFESMVREYADVLGMDPDDVVRKFEESRTYWWPNYYQPANFPKIDDAGLEGVFDTRDAFRTFAKEHYEGFKCPFCGTVAWSPECCIHREKNDGVCDYTAGGLIGPGHSIIIKEIRLAPIPILEPVKKVS